MKSTSGVENVADSPKFSSELPLKSSAGVAFVITEEEELLCEMALSGGGKRSQMIVMAVEW